LILFIVASGLVGTWGARNIQQNLEVIFAERIPSFDYLLQADRDQQQLEVAERSMIFADPKSEVFKTLLDDYETNLQQAGQRWDKYKALASTQAERNIFTIYEAARQDWLQVSRKVVELSKTGAKENRALAQKLSMGEAKQKFETMRDQLDKLQEMNQGIIKAEHGSAAKSYDSLMTGIIITLGLGLLAGIGLGVGMGRSITKSLRKIIGDLNSISGKVFSSSSQTATAGQSLAEASTEQAASLEETSSSLEEMDSMTRQNTDSAREADDRMAKTRQIVTKANDIMGELKSAMEKINQASDETANIIKTIDEIAFQTNLLALNSAVEAARAGEHGTGFAVVADEVRSLAIRASEAASNTQSLIESNIQNINNGTKLVSTTDSAFREVSESAEKVAKLVNEIASASGEQSQGIQQVNTAAAGMNQVTQRLAANADESAAGAEELRNQAHKIVTVVTDLESLVGGSKSMALASKLNQNQRVATRLAAGQASKSLLGKPRSEAAKAKEAIPLGDDDFQDF
jgi:methyl-accepting chemotaxis protein